MQVMANQYSGDSLCREATHESQHFLGFFYRKVISRFVENQHFRLEMYGTRLPFPGNVQWEEVRCFFSSKNEGDRVFFSINRWLRFQTPVILSFER
jgi:hypothetical protein